MTAFGYQLSALGVRLTRSPKLTAQGVALALFLALLACQDTNAPRGEITISLCDRSHWAAYQNEGGPWTVLGPGEGTYTFDATARLRIARIQYNNPPSVTYLYVDHLTREEAAQKFVCGSNAVPTSGSANGTLTGISALQFAFIRHGSAATNMSGSGGPFYLVPQWAAADLIATRFDSATIPLRTDRVIIRRAQLFGNGATIPPLDFASAEGFAPQANDVTFIGPQGSVSTSYFTPLRRDEHALGSSLAGPAGTAEISRTGTSYSIPDGRQAAGDLHRLRLFTVDAREVHLYYRQPANRTLTVGPLPATPTFTDVATSPSRLVRAEVASSETHGSFASFQLIQSRSDGRHVYVFLFGTSGYFEGRPATWSLTMPDLTGLAGFDSRATLFPGPFTWSLQTSSARIGLSPGNALDGEIVRMSHSHGMQP